MDSDIAPVGGKLVVCPTPIGNLQDITLRALDVLREADLILCEDTRRAGRLLAHHRIEHSGALLSFHEHNERARVSGLLARVQAGETVVLISDAGMPLVSDPGYPLLAGAIAAGLRVEVLPGASAPLVALVASGLPCERFCFVGFLPRKQAQLRRVLAEAPWTLVALESPRRIAATVTLLAAIDPRREIAVCRELTKIHEEVLRGAAGELAKTLAARPLRGEIVLVAAPASAPSSRWQEAEGAVAELRLAGVKRRDAVRIVAKLTGESANDLYAAGGDR